MSFSALSPRRRLRILFTDPNMFLFQLKYASFKAVSAQKYNLHCASDGFFHL
jgi:hypothetical protein